MVGFFSPSVIEDKIYSIMEDYLVGVDTYDKGVVDAIIDYFNHIGCEEYQLACSSWPDMTGGVCAVAFMEGGHSHLVMFDYQN